MMVAKKKTTKPKSKKAATKAVSKKTKAAVKAKPTAKKSAPPKKKKTAKLDKPYTKSELYTELAERTELPKRDVSKLFDEFTDIIAVHLKKGGPEKFVLPGILKMTVKKVAAKKARKGINPFTGEPTTFKAKPASKKIKLNALKNLKEMCQ